MMKWLKKRLIKWLLDPDVLKEVDLRLPKVKVGKNTVVIDDESIQLPALTSDPSTLAPGKLWYRSDLDKWRYSPDGSNVKQLGGAAVNFEDITTDENGEYPLPSGAVAATCLERDCAVAIDKDNNKIIAYKITNAITKSTASVLTSVTISNDVGKWTSDSSGNLSHTHDVSTNTVEAVTDITLSAQRFPNARVRIVVVE